MTKFKIILLVFVFNLHFANSQTEIISKEKLENDLTIFKKIRESANSGLYKYKTKKQIDSIYNWAKTEIQKPKTIINFYKIICKLTDFEGSVHNSTRLPDDVIKAFGETNGYFPFPVKLINGNLLVNISNTEIPLASKIIKINDIEIEQIIKNVLKYYTTDGINITGKATGINLVFAKYFKYEYGSFDEFKIEYSEPYTTNKIVKSIKSVSNKMRYEQFLNRHSKIVDSLYYTDFKKEDKYKFELKNKDIAILSSNTFNIGENENAKEHKLYKNNLEKWFRELTDLKIGNLIIDLRSNGGGTDPNDILLFSFLASKKFKENKSAFINAVKIPFAQYLVVDEENNKISENEKRQFEKELRTEFSNLIIDKYYQNEKYNKFIEPNKFAFKGKIYLLISEHVASAGSLFGALVASNTNATIIGNETAGGYYGHNGHTPVKYQLPNTKIITQFSIVNLEQDVVEKTNQKMGRGIIPDIYKTQNLEEFIKNEDNLIEFTTKLISIKN